MMRGALKLPSLVVLAAVAVIGGAASPAAARSGPDGRAPNAPIASSVVGATLPRPAGLGPQTDGRANRIAAEAAAKAVGIDISSELYGTYYVVNRETGKCLDAFASGGGVNGNKVGLWTCNDGITEQWHLYRVTYETRRVWVFLNARSWRALDYPAESYGAYGWQYQIWDYHSSILGQQFRDYYVSTRFPCEKYWECSNLEFANLLGSQGYNIMDAFASDGGGNGNRVGNFWSTGSWLQHWYLVKV
jgi:hypothetical protein